jgi:hypothetical protein
MREIRIRSQRAAEQVEVSARMVKLRNPAVEDLLIEVSETVP